ncbi:MAG: hypothetical protein Q7T97_02295 [Burkholderiaceae bacterium]|nr:hypothetical protein [Burkholderiaceae bacterium]
MSIEICPTHIEGYDVEIKGLLFSVVAEDEACATVKITMPVTVASWDEISEKVREALVMLKLETGEGV